MGTAEWAAAFGQEEALLATELGNEQEERRSSLTNQSFLPSNLFALGQHLGGGGGQQLGQHKEGGGGAVGGVQQQEEKSEWFQLFADLDPLANPDSVGRKDG